MMLGKFLQLRQWHSISTLLMLFALSGCSTSVVVKSDIPSPLVERLPINGAIRYTDEFRNYVYSEEEKKRTLKKLDFTDAQITMFDRIFGSLVTLVPVSYTHLTLPTTVDV